AAARAAARRISASSSLRYSRRVVSFMRLSRSARATRASRRPSPSILAMAQTSVSVYATPLLSRSFLRMASRPAPVARTRSSPRRPPPPPSAGRGAGRAVSGAGLPAPRAASRGVPAAGALGLPPMPVGARPPLGSSRSPAPPTPPTRRSLSAPLSPVSLADRSRARLAFLRNKSAKQVSAPEALYEPSSQAPVGPWLASRISAPQLYQSFLAIVSRLRITATRSSDHRK